MGLLDLFALFILVVLAATVVGLWIMLGMLPGKIAKRRRHPQAEAIAVCGWWGALTVGMLTPVAFMWTYTNPRWRESEGSNTQQKNGLDSGGG